MTQYSFPWNDVHGDRLYDADDFMRFFAAFLKTGVVMSYNCLLYTSDAADE